MYIDLTKIVFLTVAVQTVKSLFYSDLVKVRSLLIVAEQAGVWRKVESRIMDLGILKVAAVRDVAAITM